MWGQLVAPQSKGWAGFPPPARMTELRHCLGPVGTSRGRVLGKGRAQAMLCKTLQDLCPGLFCFVVSRPECLPSALCHLGFWPTAHACKRVGEGDLRAPGRA